ncbi:MAG TPA: Fic family protein [Solirubrobacteraceae bacterium]|nr:Fic family protein [Solirubrobacteraceae bacterium]
MTDAPLDYLSEADLLDIAVGIIGDVGVRDRGLLVSAAARPRSSAFGEDAYPTFAAKAAALMHSIARNHALIDGNKRLAWAATRIFCLLNGRDLNFRVDEAEALVVAVARGDLEVPEIAASIETHLV